MSKRVYVGKLSMEARPDDVKNFFQGYGTMTDCRILNGFGFVEFESERDADEVVRNFNGRNFMGSDLIVEFAKESRSRRNEDRGGGYNSERGPRYGRGPKVPGIRLIVTGVSRDTSWQDLKDFARQAGNVTFADIDRDVPNQGLVEYATREEAEKAIQDLDNQDIRGSTVRVAFDTRRPSGGGGGGGYGSRGGGGGGGRDRWDGGYGGRRDRSRSPRRGGGGYDDRRSARHDDRRDRYEDRDRDRDDRRRDDRERRGGGGGGGGERAPVEREER